MNLMSKKNKESFTTVIYNKSKKKLVVENNENQYQNKELKEQFVN